MALVVSALETPRGWVPLDGFPWGRVALSQPEGTFTSLASIGGAPLVGFAVMLCGFGLARLLLDARQTSWRPRRSLLAPALTAVLPIAAGLAVWPSIGTDAKQGT